MKKYPSKISYGLLLFVLAVPIGTIFPLISSQRWFAIGVNLCIVTFILILFFNLFYAIDEEWLYIKLGLVLIKKIDIRSIQIMSETNSLVSAPAVSLDRLEIIYSKHQSTIISPRDKSGFIDHITLINPNITVQYKPL